MRNPSHKMPVRDFLMKKVLNKAQETAKTWAIMMCMAHGYDEKETKKAFKELRKTGQVYCCRREEFFKVT